MAIIVEALNCGQFRFLIQQGFDGADLQDQTQASIKKHREACSTCSQFHNHLVALVSAANMMNTPSETQLADFEGVVQQIFEDLDDDSRRGFIEILCNLFPLGKLLLALQLAVDGRDPDATHTVTMNLRAPANGHWQDAAQPPVETPTAPLPQVPVQTQAPVQSKKGPIVPPLPQPVVVAAAPPAPAPGQVPGQKPQPANPLQQTQTVMATSVMTSESASVAYQIEPPEKPDFDEMPPQLNFARSGQRTPPPEVHGDSKDSGSRKKLFDFDDQDIDDLFRRNLGLHELQHYLSTVPKQPLPVPPTNELTDFEAFAETGIAPQMTPTEPTAEPHFQAIQPSLPAQSPPAPEPAQAEQSEPQAEQSEQSEAQAEQPELQAEQPEQPEKPEPPATEPELKPSPPVMKPSPPEPAPAPVYKEKLGRLDASKVDTSNEDGSIGTIRSVGKFLFDPNDAELFQNMISRSESRQNVREVTVEAAEAVDKLMEFIGAQPGVVGSLMLGADGSIVAHRIPRPYDVDTVSIWSLCAYLNSSNATKMMGHNSVKQIISQTKSGYVIIVNFHGGILVTIVDGGTTNSLVGLMRMISKLTE